MIWQPTYWLCIQSCGPYSSCGLFAWGNFGVSVKFPTAMCDKRKSYRMGDEDGWHYQAIEIGRRIQRRSFLSAISTGTARVGNERRRAHLRRRSNACAQFRCSRKVCFCSEFQPLEFLTVMWEVAWCLTSSLFDMTNEITLVDNSDNDILIFRLSKWHENDKDYDSHEKRLMACWVSFVASWIVDAYHHVVENCRIAAKQPGWGG